MMGDTTYFAVCNEECSLWYFSERSSLTKMDTDAMYPYERGMTLDLFKTYDEHIEHNRKEQMAKKSGKEIKTAW
jgi:hypothetical protein